MNHISYVYRTNIDYVGISWHALVWGHIGTFLAVDSNAWINTTTSTLNS